MGKKQVVSEDPEFKVSIAVDFGTDGIGVAYAYNNEIHVHSKWGDGDSKYGEQVKPKTIILLNESAEPINFGMDAMDNYILNEKNQRK